jgi:hydrogenase maturation protease
MSFSGASSGAAAGDVLVRIVGIGNVLMGDEGVGVHVVRYLAGAELPPQVDWLDGGTGGFGLLGPLQSAASVILVDATIDGGEPGALRKLKPRFSNDYPPTLSAHDIGLKDLLDAFYLLGESADVTLFAVSIAPPLGLATELSPALERRVPAIASAVREEALQRLQCASSWPAA